MTNLTQWQGHQGLSNQSESDFSEHSSETLSVYGHKERKTERKAHCAWGTIRRAAPIEKDWSRLLSEVYISAPEGAHCALCAHWMAHMKNTHPCRDTHRNTHIPTSVWTKTPRKWSWLGICHKVVQSCKNNSHVIPDYSIQLSQILSFHWI